MRELIKENAVIRSELDTARSDYEDAKVALSNAETALKDLPADVDTAEPSELLAQAAKLGDVTNTLVAAKIDADAVDLALSESLGRLGLWSGTAEDLAALPVPDVTAVDQSEEHRVAAQQDFVALSKKIAETKRESLQVDADLAGLAAAGEVPSPKAIRDARDERDGRWHWIRSRFVQPVEAFGELAAGVADPDLVGTYETSVRHADELVDRREAEAQRVAQLTTFTANQKKITKALVDLDAQRIAAEEKIQRLDSEWHELWRDTGVMVKSPVEMARWLTRKDEVLRLLGEARKAAGKLREAHAAADYARTLLEKATQILGLSEPMQELGALDRQLRQTLSKLQAVATEKSAAETKIKTAREGVEKTKNALKRAATAELNWQAAWQSAVVEIHLAPTAGVVEAETALDAWETIPAPLTKRKEDQRRHKGLNEDQDQFRADVAVLVAEIGENSLIGAPIEKVVRDLKTRLDAAKGVFQERANLGKRIDDLRTAFDVAREQHRSANFVIDGMRKNYGFGSDADAYDLARCSSQRRGRMAQIDERTKELIRAGDALDETTLQAEVDSVPPDQANAELATIHEEESRLIAKISTSR